MTSQSIFESPYGSFSLQRFPDLGNDTLRAWDAADELSLDHLALNDPAEKGATALQGKRILLVNDQFGGLAAPLHDAELTCWNDSFLSHCGIRDNLLKSGAGSQPVFLPSTAIPEGHFDIIIIKVPKVLAFLEYQLRHIATLLKPNTVIVGAAMAKNIHNSTLKLFEKYLGVTTTSLAKKKARLIFSEPRAEPKNKHLNPTDLLESYTLEPFGFELAQQANSFSREKLDIGARFFIEHLHQLPAAKHIVDVGCGNGVLSMVAHYHQPKAKLTLIDESYMAIASARDNLTNGFSEVKADSLESGALDATYLVADGLAGSPLQDVDLIICNPPFHQGMAVNDRVAKRMFKQSHAQLSAGGELWIVANRHLPYKQVLQRLFSKTYLIAENAKFVVLRAVKV